MDTVVAEAKEWRKIEAFSQSSTSTPPSRQQENPASMARNRQVPRRSGSANGVASEVILRATAWCHPQWHQVGSGGILLQRASSALRTRETTGVIVVLEGGGSSEGSGSSRSTSAQQQHQASKNNPGSSGSGSGGAAPQRTVQVDASSTTVSAPVAAPAVPSAAAPGAMPAAAPGWVHKVRGLLVGRLILPPCRLSPLGRLHLRSLRSRGVKWGSRRLGMRMKCP